MILLRVDKIRFTTNYKSKPFEKNKRLWHEWHFNFPALIIKLNVDVLDFQDFFLCDKLSATSCLVVIAFFSRDAHKHFSFDFAKDLWNVRQGVTDCLNFEFWWSARENMPARFARTIYERQECGVRSDSESMTR